MEVLLNETQLSEMLQVSLACLRRWRLRGEGPEYKKVGPLVRYRHEAVVQWVDGLPTGGNGRRLQPVDPPSKRPLPAVSGSRSLHLDHNGARNVA
jgi:hypothetical protein